MQQIFSTEAYRAANYKFLDYLSLNSNKLGIGSNVDMDNANIQPYTIRLHAKLVNGQNTYEFRLKGAIAPLSIEKTLADSDIFQGYAMALCLQLQILNPACGHILMLLNLLHSLHHWS